MKTKIYNVKTGECIEIYSIDAKDRVKSGGWSYEPKKVSNVKHKRLGSSNN